MLRDVINKFEETQRLIEGSVNPHTNLLIIINFFSYCEKHSSLKIYSAFINDFIPYLIDIFRHHNLNYIDPEYILKANYILNHSLSCIKSKEDLLYKDLITSQRNLKLQLIKSYFNIGEVENGLELIKEYSGIENPVLENSISKVKNKNSKKIAGSGETLSLTKAESFDSYYLFKVMNEINIEIDRLRNCSSSMINILFTTEDVKSQVQSGFALQCSVDITDDKNIKSYGIVFENTLDYRDADINNSINIVKSNFERLLIIHKLKVPKNKSFKVKFENLSGVYRGGSFISGITLILFVKYFNSLNRQSVLTISTAAAITGALDENGNFKNLPQNSIRTKVYAAYFSWIRQLIIPEGNLNDANELLLELRNKYPNKIFKIIPAKSIETLITENNILKEERIPLTKHIYNNYKGATLSIIFLLILLATIVSFKTVFKPPEKPLPKTSNDTYLIYTPDRNDKWVFQNQFQGNGDTIKFGDVAVGDMWYPIIEFRNNSSKQEEFKFLLAGKDKDDFEIVWRDEPGQESVPVIKPDAIQRLYIKFRPLSVVDTGYKKAVLKILVNNDFKEIYLAGKSGLYKGGYSLAFKKPEDYLIINNNSNFVGKNFVIDFRIKPFEITKGLTTGGRVGFLFDDNGSNSKFNMGINSDSTLYFAFFNRKNSDYLAFYKSVNKLNFNNWNHIKIILNQNRLTISLNDVLTTVEKQQKINLIPDYIYLGYGDYPERPDNRKKESSYLKFNLADFKILADNKDEILSYRFEETNFETSYDLSNNDIWGKIKGGIVRSLDYPLETKQVAAKFPNSALEISGRGIMQCTKNLFTKKSSFTISLDAYLFSKEINTQKHLYIFSRPDFDLLFVIDTSKAVLGFYDKMKSYAKLKEVPFNYYDNWHRYTFQYSLEEKTFTAYIDSIKIAQIDSLTNDFDVSKWLYGIAFGNYTFFYSPRLVTSKVLLDDIYIYNQKVSIEKAFSKDMASALAIWDFENVSNILAFDKLHNIPAFLWQTYKIVPKI